MWHLVRKGTRHREFRAVCCQSPTLGRVSAKDDGRCLCASIMIFKRSDAYVLHVVVNGQTVGHFGCPAVHRTRHIVEGLSEPVYLLYLLAPLFHVKLGFTPYVVVPKSISGSPGLVPGIIYQNLSVVSSEEAASLIGQPGSSCPIILGLGGAGVWARIYNSTVVIYTFALCFDLYAACCDRVCFPSLAKVFFESVRCSEETCRFCSDTGRHVDATAQYCGCTPDSGVCFCYAPCTGTSATVINGSFLPYLESEGGGSIHNIFIRRLDGKKGSLPLCVSDCIGARDEHGNEVPVRREPWKLFKIEETLSRMIVLACPILKRIVMEHV